RFHDRSLVQDARPRTAQPRGARADTDTRGAQTFRPVTHVESPLKASRLLHTRPWCDSAILREFLRILGVVPRLLLERTASLVTRSWDATNIPPLIGGRRTCLPTRPTQ